MAGFPMRCKWIGAMLSRPSALLFLLDFIASSTILVEIFTSFNSNCLILRTIAPFFLFVFVWVWSELLVDFVANFLCVVNGLFSKIGVFLGILAFVFDRPLTVDQSLLVAPR